MSSSDRFPEVIQDKYRIRGILGQGGVAITYKAIALETNCPVAIKVISLRQLDNWKQVELFQREAEVLKQLNHPAIPQYIEYFDLETDKDKAFYLVQEIAPGKSLHQLVESGWRATEQEVKYIAQQVLEILAYLHSLDPPVIHRDIKPNNLIRRDDGKIYLVDFGAVKNTYYNTLMQGSTVVGTYGYMAPEQFRGQALPATDLYSLGATLLYLLTHRSPAELPQDTLQLDFRSAVNIDDPFAEWLEKILEPDLEARFDNANIALRELSKNCDRQPNKLIKNIAIATLAIGLLAGFNTHKWFFISRLGYSPSRMCFSPDSIESYIEDGGKANITLDRRFNHKTSLLHCVVMMYEVSPKLRAELVEMLLEKGVDINHRDSYFNTPLLVTRDLDLAELLIAKGADVNAKDKQGNSVLHRVITNRYINNLAMAKLLIENGANVSAKNNLGNSVLEKAIERKDIVLARLLIDRGADVAGDKKVLFTAVSRGNLDLVKLLIARGVDLQGKDQKNNNILFNAVTTDNLAMVRLFLDLGVDPKHKNNYGVNPLTLVKSKEIAELLIDRGADVNSQVKYSNARSWQYGTTPLFNAISRRNIDLIGLLLESGAEVNLGERQLETIRISKYDTPLVEALKQNNLKIVKLLLDYGANVRDRSKDDKNVFLYANSQEIAQLLLDRGIDANARETKDNNSLLFEVDNLEIVRVLIENGADVNAKNNSGNTPLFHCLGHRPVFRFLRNPTLFHSKDVAKMKLLIESGADVNARNHHGETPLFKSLDGTSTFNSKFEILQILLTNGADVNAKNSLGQTPFSQAIYQQNATAVRLFLNRGADTSYLDIEKIRNLYQLSDRQLSFISQFLITNNF